MSKNIHKNELKKLLQLSNSYLHDSANLFALAHSNLKELSLKIKNAEDGKLKQENLTELMNLLNFLKGSEYHFKDIFHDLENLSESSLSKETAYPLNIVDLKDLLEMELLDIFTHKRIKFSDNIVQNNAQTKANFPLITKCLFNLIENALKHCNGEVKISLDDAKDHWKLSIISAEGNLSIDLEKSLKQAASSAQGHGLKSVLEILKYNNVEIEFLSLAAAGSLINLYFSKVKDTDKIVNLEDSKKSAKQRNEEAFIKKLSLKKFFDFKIFIAISIISISFWGINLTKNYLELNYRINQISRSPRSKETQYKFFKLKNIIEKDIHYLKKIELCKEIISKHALPRKLGRVAERTSSRLRRTNDHSVLRVISGDVEDAKCTSISYPSKQKYKLDPSSLHEDHEDDENAEIGVPPHAQLKDKEFQASNEKLITAMILKKDLVNFNEINLNESELNSLKAFSKKLDLLYELDYFLARNFRHRDETILEYYYEAKATYKQLYCFLFPSLERKALEENNLDLGLEMALGL